MNHYEARLEDRRARLEAAAEKKQQEALGLYNRANTLADVIPFGQPILVGHHSEGRDRNYRKKISRTFDRSFEANNEAKDLARRAAAVGTAGISSDDPEAVVKLREKLAELEAGHETSRRANAAYRKGGLPALAEVSPELAATFADHLRIMPYLREPCSMSHSSANIRRVKERIEMLKREQARREESPAPAVTQAAGYTIREDLEDNRIAIEFSSRAPKEACDLLKMYGFRWSPTRTAWVRMLNQAGRNTAEILRPRLESIIAGSASD